MKLGFKMQTCKCEACDNCLKLKHSGLDYRVKCDRLGKVRFGDNEDLARCCSRYEPDREERLLLHEIEIDALKSKVNQLMDRVDYLIALHIKSDTDTEESPFTEEETVEIRNERRRAKKA